jgi:hypothetical protein
VDKTRDAQTRPDWHNFATFPDVLYPTTPPYVIGLTDSTREGINVPTYPKPPEQGAILGPYSGLMGNIIPGHGFPD